MIEHTMQRTWIRATVDKVEEEVFLRGWVHARRDMGKLIFIDVRDMTGICQVVFLPQHAAVLQEAGKLRPEFVVSIRGKVNARPEKQVHPALATGTVEIEALTLTIENEAETPPFEVAGNMQSVNEELRMQYRYLDLRSDRMQKNLLLRHCGNKAMRDFFSARNFLEVETPILTKSTPEGARDYLVPARNFKNEFYALPQSPQQYKQLLAVGGVEQYFQIAKCFRDEETRKDRQPEFTQLDMEMTFVEREDVMAIIEEMYIAVVQDIAPQKKIQDIPFPRVRHQEAMQKYGTDRPDVRKNPDDANTLAFCWVTDFPFFERTENRTWTFTHNPFSAPISEHLPLLRAKERIGEILTTQYDVVLNGYEIGGGSIRNHRAEDLHHVLEILGHAEEAIEQQFGHMLRAFRFGAPPHGGIALGLDRFYAILCGMTESIRDVIAFPKTGEGRDLLMNAPSRVAPEQLAELGLLYTSRHEEQS